MEYLKKLNKENLKRFASVETQWGHYPVLAIRGKTEGQINFKAWVGLNNPEAGCNLVFDLVHPDKKGHSNNAKDS